MEDLPIDANNDVNDGERTMLTTTAEDSVPVPSRCSRQCRTRCVVSHGGWFLRVLAQSAPARASVSSSDLQLSVTKAPIAANPWVPGAAVSSSPAHPPAIHKLPSQPTARAASFHVS